MPLAEYVHNVVLGVFLGLGGGFVIAAVMFFFAGIGFAPLVLIVGLILGYLGLIEVIHPEKSDYSPPNASSELEAAS